MELNRFLACSHGTFGQLGTLFTCEEEAQGNQRNISAIPAGEYLCKRTIYHRHGYETFEVCDVPGRTRILFHPGNTEEDSDGCILLGMKLGVLVVEDEDTHRRVTKLSVILSRVAFDFFMHKLNGVDSFTLVITDPEA
jgi:hypothetical protein